MSSDDKITNISSKINTLLNLFENVIRHIEKFTKEWKVDESKLLDLKRTFQDIKKQIKINEPRLNRKTLKCVVFGRISSGKSALINALLAREILPSEEGPTTKCFVEVKKSIDDTNYVVFPCLSNNRRDLESIRTVDLILENEVTPGSRGELFYSSQDCPLLSRDIVIVDTPGIDSTIEMDSEIKRECEDADVLLLVVSSRCGFGEAEKNFIERYNTEFSLFNIFIIFNLWDVIPPARSAGLKEPYTKSAQEYLQSINTGISANFSTRIYFVSATERLRAGRTEMNTTTPEIKERNDVFDQFLAQLKTSLAVSSASRKSSIIEANYAALSVAYDSVGFNRPSRTDMTKSVEEKMNKLADFNEIINAKVLSSFQASYAPFFKNCLDVVKMEQVEGGMSVQNKLKYLIDETMVVTMESLKRNIIDSLKVDESDKDECIKALKDLYFPFDLNILEEKNKINYDELEKSILEIIRKKKICTAVSIAGSTIAGAAIAGAALAGAAIADAAIAGAAIAGNVATSTLSQMGNVRTTAIMATVGAVLGAAGGGSISTAVVTSPQNAFQSFFKSEEAVIKEWWIRIRDSLLNTYNEFLKNISKKIVYINKPIDKDIGIIKNSLESLKEDFVGLNG